jgi:hypothetical protein
MRFPNKSPCPDAPVWSQNTKAEANDLASALFFDLSILI